MASKIRILSEHTINKIAAGEVIENPASVVKELVENSIDSGATEICVEIKGGGRQLIRITDNGSGMGPDDALLCLERHATSKIRDVEDIYSIHTMGFRGEAVPSIASISKFTILTCQTGASEGTMVIVEGGKIIQTCPVARSPGTTIEVKALFFNIPVRKKFQKSPIQDTNEIFKIFSNIALGHPHLKFQLISNQETLLSTPSCLENSSFHEKLEQRIASILGAEFLSGICPLDSCENEFKVKGFIGLPSFTRQNRSGQHLFINQRAVVSPLVSFAVKDGYGTTLMTNRHPVYVLHLTLPEDLIDVNVHPQKREVRLRQEQAIRQTLIHAIEKALQQVGISSLGSLSSLDPLDSVAPFPSFSENFDNANENSIEFPLTAPFHSHFSNQREENFENSYWMVDKPLPDPFFEMPPKVTLPTDESRDTQIPHAFSASKITPYTPLTEPQNSSHSMSVQEAPALFAYSATSTGSPAPRVLAILKQYILLEESGLHGKAGLCLVDQRAAHARVIYEKLLIHTCVEAQILLIPHLFETTPIEARALSEHLEYLNQIGIGIHQSAPQAFSIDSVPQFFGNGDVQVLISNIVQSMSEWGNQSGLKKEKEKVIALAASRAAISQNKRLSHEEAQALINQLMGCQMPAQSPLGKPTWIHISYEELSKKFQGFM